MSRREQLTRGFLWFSVFGLGIGLGAKLFDLVVVAASWSASPPESLKLMPYGPNYPVNPGHFFQPLNVLMIVPIIGALISGWKTPREYRIWLWLPVIALFLISIFTPTVFWPMIHELWDAGTGEITMSPTELSQLIRRWMIGDWLRVTAVTVAFLSSIKAISIPYPR